MNFEADILATAKEVLDFYGVPYADCKETRDIVFRWINVNMKMIKPSPRDVIEAAQLASSPHYPRYKEAINRIKGESQLGKDLNKFLSKTIFKPDYHDPLFYDWGICHFHLGQDIAGQYFVERSDHLLFLFVDRTELRFIDIREHGEELLFCQKDLLAKAVMEWPSYMKTFEVNCLGLSHVIENPKDIDKLRKAGITAFQEVDGKVFFPKGGGLTTAKTGINVTIQVDKLFKMARTAERWADSNSKMLAEKLGTPESELNIHFVLFEDGWNLFEEKTKTKLCIF